MKGLQRILILLGFIFSFILGAASLKYYPGSLKSIYSTLSFWENQSASGWSGDYSVVLIPSSLDRETQSAYYRKTTAVKKPLLVSLHTWSWDFDEYDPLARFAQENDWNYIHPGFRGANNKKDACLSDKVLSDLDDSIQFAIDSGSVDLDNIFVVGMSGGGYATLGLYLKTRHNIKSFLSWVPISDLSTWYWEARSLDLKHADDILKCTSSGPILNNKKAKLRSPLYWSIPAEKRGRLEIYAGLNDGHIPGVVPISQSLLFFNRLVTHYGYPQERIEESDMIKLLTRSIDRNDDLGEIANRKVFYKRDTPPVALTIFDGHHEILPEYTFQRLKDIIEQGS